MIRSERSNFGTLFLSGIVVSCQLLAVMPGSAVAQVYKPLDEAGRRHCEARGGIVTGFNGETCQTRPPDHARLQAPSKTRRLDDAARAECLARGGRIGAFMSGEFCAEPTPDAGAICTDSSQCAGVCLVPGRCSSHAPMWGCYATVEGGKAMPEACVD